MPAVTSQVNVDLSGLTKLKKGLAKGYFAKVGYLGSNAPREGDDGINNPTLAVIMEYGSVSQNIPPRSTLRMPIQTHGREITEFLTSGDIKRDFEAGRMNDIFTKLGVFAENIVQEAFETGGFGKWAPLKKATIARKGSSAILIDTAQLRRSVTSEVQSG